MKCNETDDRFEDLCRRWESGETLTPQELADMTEYQMDRAKDEQAKAARATAIVFGGATCNSLTNN